MGSEEEPVTAWVEYIGPLKIAQHVYDHIFGVRFRYSGGKIDTVYYENYDIRNGSLKFDFNKYI